MYFSAGLPIYMLQQPVIFQRKIFRQVKKISFLGDSTMDSRHWSAVAAFPDILSVSAFSADFVDA